MRPAHHHIRQPFLQTDCAVVGGGLAGCTAALELADAGQQVDLFVKGRIERDSNSLLVAGGLAAVPMSDGKPILGDSFKLHIKDTLAAGNGLNDDGVVASCVRHFFPDVIEWLEGRGMRFDRNGKGRVYDLHREGGHSTNRIFHVGDWTGAAIMGALAKRVLRHPRIRVHEEHVAIDLITRHKLRRSSGPDACHGIYVYDCETDRVVTVSCKAVFLATGGLGKVFLYTTNADIATGDGFAICYRAGLPLANMEFVQFHPSVFYDVAAVQEDERRFLLTEALRGAGAILKLHRDDTKDFMLKHHPSGSNATRDVVTRAQDIEMRRHGLKHLWLDCTSIPRAKFLSDFKSSFDYCKRQGVDMSREPVPIIYAAHYSNGGVLTGPNGETAMLGCYVLGETAYTGLHGATRLASNSAPECVLFGRLTARHFLEEFENGKPAARVPLWRVGRAKPLRDMTTVSYYWNIIRRTMSGMCGIARNEERLQAAKEVLSSIRKNIHEFYWHYRVTRDFLEVRNIADVAMIITESALARRESRACHWREDFAHRDDRRYRKLTVVRRNRPVSLKRIGG